MINGSSYLLTDQLKFYVVPGLVRKESVIADLALFAIFSQVSHTHKHSGEELAASKNLIYCPAERSEVTLNEAFFLIKGASLRSAGQKLLCFVRRPDNTKIR